LLSPLCQPLFYFFDFYFEKKMLFLGNNPELGHDIRCEGTSFYFEKKCKPHDIMMAD
jgi:hypothetical protein